MGIRTSIDQNDDYSFCIQTNSLISLGTVTIITIRGYFETCLKLSRSVKTNGLGLASLSGSFCKSTVLYEASGDWALQRKTAESGAQLCWCVWWIALVSMKFRGSWFSNPGRCGMIFLLDSNRVSGFRRVESRDVSHALSNSKESSQVMKKDTSEAREMKPQTCRETNVLSQRKQKEQKHTKTDFCWTFAPSAFLMVALVFHLARVVWLSLRCLLCFQMWFLEPGPTSFLGRFSIDNRRLSLSQGVQWSCLSEGAAWMKRFVAFLGGWCLQRAGVFEWFWFWSFTSWCWQS